MNGKTDAASAGSAKNLKNPETPTLCENTMQPPEITIRGVVYAPVAADPTKLHSCRKCICAMPGGEMNMELCTEIYEALLAKLDLPRGNSTHNGYYYVVKDPTPDPNPL